MLLGGMNIEDLAQLRDQVISTLADKVAERQRELTGEAERLSRSLASRFSKPLLRPALSAR